LDSARMILRMNYWFPDSSGTVGLEAHRYLRTIPAGAFTWDTATAPGAFSDTISAS
jgi:hypothetical protein